MSIRQCVTVLLSSHMLFACRTVKPDSKALQGIFYRSVTTYGFVHEYRLELIDNKTFFLTEMVTGATPGCNGKWEISNDTISLVCNEPESILEALTSGYMTKRTHVVRVVDINSLELDGVILQRVSQ